jgi:hypothetical protein
VLDGSGSLQGHWTFLDATGEFPGCRESDLSNSGGGPASPVPVSPDVPRPHFDPWQEHIAIQHYVFMKAQIKNDLQVSNWQIDISKALTINLLTSVHF